MATNSKNANCWTYVKKALKSEEEAFSGIEERVRSMLAEIKTGGKDVVLRLSKELDKYEGEVVVTREQMKKASETVPAAERKMIEYAHKRVKIFAEAQRKSISEFEIPIGEGGTAGQKVVPMQCAGCYCPGGRYCHIASAIMSVTTAKAAGVTEVVLASPPKPGVGVPPAILYAAYIAGADYALALGGVQAVGALKHGFFTGTAANILVGPGSGYVAEAKRQLSGPDCAIDMFAGPTEIGILADEACDPEVVAVDLVSQGEHGPTSPCWLVTTSKEVADTVAKRVPELLEHLPEPNRSACRSAWTDYGEIVLVKDLEEAIKKMDEYAPEHLELLCKDSSLELLKKKLRNYGSLFVGEGTCVTYGDKASGPNHTLPTRRAAMQSGGLSVHKFLKILTWQDQKTDSRHEELGIASAIISRMEGMEGHAWAADVRLAKYAANGEKRRKLLQDSGAEKSGVAHLFDASAKFVQARDGSSSMK
eukprot:TRINITY_DN111118_c0_g1_i1.p1 TRINITY_DN111118_c0_g1~~TRINITY_DN111118_c0_g1_i1.p1  ORF type:complete len:478 (-),score=119.34 TRINITY_DN111118_c0_g1_i1:299-1732(-)